MSHSPLTVMTVERRNCALCLYCNLQPKTFYQTLLSKVPPGFSTAPQKSHHITQSLPRSTILHSKIPHKTPAYHTPKKAKHTIFPNSKVPKANESPFLNKKQRAVVSLNSRSRFKSPIVHHSLLKLRARVNAQKPDVMTVHVSARVCGVHVLSRHTLPKMRLNTT